MKWTEDILNFLFPPHCPICGAYVEKRGDWCEPCLKKTMEVHRLPLDPAMSRVIAGAWALGYYRGGLRDLLRDLKYRKRMQALPCLKTFQHAAEPALSMFLEQKPLAVPVPLHADREKQRGFNQAELIFREWLEEHGIPMERLLVRCRETKPQYGLGAKERRENLKGAFAVKPDVSVEGIDILLVDDIFTTGATLYECAKILRENGAGKIYAMAMASDHR